MQIKKNNRNLFLFWDGKERPALIKLLHNIIANWSLNGKNFIPYVFNRVSIENAILVPKQIDRFNWANQTDYYRTHLVAKYGGIWMDSDMIVMNDLSDLYDRIDNDGCFFIQEDHHHLSSGCFGAAAEHPAVVRWAEKTKKIVLSGSADEWGSLGPLALTECRDEGLIDPSEIIFGPHNVYPILPGFCEAIFHSHYNNWPLISREYQPFITLVHHVVDKFDDDITIEEILQKPIALTYFLHKTIQGVRKLHNIETE